MNDVLYVAGTIGFFALMLAYVAACAKVGRSIGSAETADETR